MKEDAQLEMDQNTTTYEDADVIGKADIVVNATTD